MSLLTIDERMREALSRLTENEKLCLRRRLMPQTAKEMAIELGISPHAVEKRLKMARAKLGVSSSVTAARLLARMEADQPSVPQSSDIAGLVSGPQKAIVAAANPNRKRWRRLLPGGLPMIAAALLIALVAQDAPAPPVKPGSHAIRLDQIETRKVDMNEASAFDAEAFSNLDIDRSGFLDRREASALEPRDSNREAGLPPAPPAGTPDPAAERKWMAKLDTDRDGKVSQQEYISYMIPWTLYQGVPAFWHPKH